MSDEVARVEEVTKHYRLGSTSVRALRGVSVKIFGGELVALAGPSGSGKTTLLNLIGCLDRPDTGSVYLGEDDVSKLRDSVLARVRRSRLGFVFQTFNLFPVLSAFENVEYPLLLSRTPTRERRQRVGELLEHVGLGTKARHRPNELSGGERQRVAIARALANRPALVLADEPTASLDSVSGGAVLDLMRQMRDALGTTFLFASHDPRLLARMDRVISIRDGEAAESRVPMAVAL